MTGALDQGDWEKIISLYDGFIRDLPAKTRKVFADTIEPEINELKIKIKTTTSITTYLKELESNLTNIQQTSNNCTDNHMTYAQAATKPVKYSTILVKPTTDSNSDDYIDRVNTIFKKNTNICVNKTVITKKNIRITTEDTRLAEKLNKIFMDESIDLNASLMKPLDPQLTFTVNQDQFEDEVEFKARNNLDTSPSSRLTIVSKIPIPASRYNKSERFRIVMRMSRETREEIARRNNLYMGGQSLRYYDYIYVKSCSNCYNYGHSRRQCESVDPKCNKCEGNHSSENCSEPRTKRCLFCVSTGETNTEHKPKSIECPSFQKIASRLKAITDWNF